MEKSSEGLNLASTIDISIFLSITAATEEGTELKSSGIKKVGKSPQPSLMKAIRTQEKKLCVNTAEILGFAILF